MTALIGVFGLALFGVGCAHADAYQVDRNVDRGRIELLGDPVEAREVALTMIRHHCGSLFQAEEGRDRSQVTYRCGANHESIDAERPPALAVSSWQR